MEEFLLAYGGQTECSSKHKVEKEKGEWRDQEIRLVYFAKIHRFDPFSFHQKDAGQYHSKH